METCIVKWQTHAKIGKITPKWVIELITWSIVTAYIPNIIWYFTGYPLNAVLMQFLVMTIGMPPVLYFSMRSYQKQYATLRLNNSLCMKQEDILITKDNLSETSHRYVEIWKTKDSLIDEIIINNHTGQMLVTAIWHVEAYVRKRNGECGSLIDTDFITKTLEIKISPDKIEQLEEFLKQQYKDKTIIESESIKHEQET